MLSIPKPFIALDLECTTWEGAIERRWSFPWEHREVVQAGVVRVEDDFKEIESRLWYVKPKINPELSTYFMNLTHITQAEVDKHGLDFPDFLEELVLWCKDDPIYSFGDGDPNMLRENCALRELAYPFEDDRFHNVRDMFEQYGFHVQQSGHAPQAFGLELPARPHNALNDARGLLIGLCELNKRV